MIVVHRLGDPPGPRIQIAAQIWREPEWDGLLTALPNIQAALLVCPRAPSKDYDGRIRALRFACPMLPLVLSVRSSTSDVRSLSGFADQLLVSGRRLPDVDHVVRACSRARWLRGFDRRIEGATTMDPRLRRLLRTGLANAVPITLVRAFAEAGAVSSATAERYWREHWCGEPPLRLADYLAWIALLRIHAAKAPRTSWKGVTGQLRVRRRRILRWVKSYLDLPQLDAFEALPTAALDVRVERRVCDHLLRPAREAGG